LNATAYLEGILEHTTLAYIDAGTAMPTPTWNWLNESKVA